MLLGLLLAACHAPDPPTATPGELTIAQLDLRGAIGDSAMIVGPDGTTVLIDVGDDRHADDVLAAVRGRIDAVLLTHFHADHGGALADVLKGADVGELVTRGPVDLGSANEDVSDVAFSADVPRVDLCSDGGCELPWTMDLGGPVLTVLAADARVAGDDTRAVADPTSRDDENALSLAGTVTWGDFTYAFGGDLTGGGKGTQDVEGRVGAVLGPADVVHLDHHGIDSSTSQGWIDAVLPDGGDDGSRRTAIVGTNRHYLDAPADEVLDRLRGRVDAVWVPTPGRLTGDDPLLHVADGPVVVRVQGDGTWTVGDG